MTDFDFNQELRPKMNIEANQKQEYKYIGSIKVRPGHTLFMIHLETGEVHKAAIRRTNDIDLKGNIVNNTKTTLDPKYYYVSALNRENALKKFKKVFPDKL